MTAIFFFMIIIAILIEVYEVSKGVNLTAALIVTAILLLVPLSCVLVFPMYIIADDEGIGIRTIAYTVRIPYENIDHIERFDDQHPLFINKGKVGKVTLGPSFQMGGRRCVWVYRLVPHQGHWHFPLVCNRCKEGVPDLPREGQAHSHQRQRAG